MAGTDLIRTSDLIRHNDIFAKVEASAITHDMSQEDLEKTKAEWTAGGTVRDLAVVSALDAANEGRLLVDITTVIARGGKSPKYQRSSLPSLTVCPPLAKEVSMRVWHDGEMTLRARNGRRNWKMELNSGYTFDRGTAISYSAVATAPLMPPRVRDLAQKDNLLLWEPEWRKVNVKVQRPPLDPALLEHVIGNLWTVVATWDLSPLEAAALS